MLFNIKLALLFALILIFYRANSVNAGGFYTVVAPSNIRPNMEYILGVSVYDVPSPVQITVSIEGHADNGNYNSISTVAILSSGDMQIAGLSIGEWISGNYSLTVTGRDGLNFSQQTVLIFKPKSYSVFIQTDKPIYRPGDKVRFRAVIVDHLLIPTLTGAIDIRITDSNSNWVKQWKRVFTSKGVVSKEFQLSDQPLLGDWTIHLEILGQDYKKTFTVAEYVLPTFDVKVIVPKYATYNQSDVVINVKATYTHGKGVAGDVLLRAESSSHFYSEVNPKVFETRAQIDGSIDIPVNVVADVGLTTNYDDYRVLFTAEVTEKHTGRKYNSSATLRVFEHDINVQLIRLSETFKPGLPYNCLFKVSYRDDTPVIIKADDYLHIYYGDSYQEEKWEKLEAGVVLPQSGLVNVTIPALKTNISLLAMKAVFRGVEHYPTAIQAAVSPSDNYLQVNLMKLADDHAEILVTATERLTYLVYQVMSRGNIVSSQRVAVPGNTQHHFKLPITQRMSPKARLLVFYIRTENKEVVADAINFDVSGIFRTPVALWTNESRTKPGAMVDVVVQTKPNAYVGLLAVDQSVLLLKSGNDITPDDVIEELQMYDAGKKKRDFHYGQRKRRSLWWSGSSTAAQMFSDSGVVVLTNAWVYEELEMVTYRFNGLADHPEEDMAFTTDAMAPAVRSFFPETWLWNSTQATSDGKVVLSSKVPDSITSWVISAFAVDPVFGLGVCEEPTKMTVFRPFFVRLSLPYSVVRGETLQLQVMVFNYNSKAISAEVTLENGKDEFYFTLNANDVDGPTKRETKTVTVPPESNLPVIFIITPLKLGYIDLLVSAISSQAGDTVLRKLLVKPEGKTHYHNDALLLDLRVPVARNLQTAIKIKIPDGIVEGSEAISISAIGDLLGPTINNLDQLLRLPVGCGEQNMLNFVPSIVVLEYLDRANRLNPTIRNKALLYMETGYQRELTYQREDGSFSAFGKEDKSGSTWLTSFVLKAFKQASRHIDVDGEILKKAMKWLIRHQREDGAFSEPGEVHNKAMQGASGTGIALSAYTLIALLENQAHVNYGKEMTLAAQFVEREASSTNDPYILAITTYCLHLADSPLKDEAFSRLTLMAQSDDDMLYWPAGIGGLSQSVETTAYALLSYVMRGEASGGALPLVRWLISKQNENGGYLSTQDTVIAIQALAAVANHLASPTISLQIHHNNGFFNISTDNTMVLQKQLLPPSTRTVPISAEGFGVGIVQVSWQYNVLEEPENALFSLKPKIQNEAENNGKFDLNICTHYLGKDQDRTTNMAVMEVGLPSGYQSDLQKLQSLLTNVPDVKRVETRQGASSVVIYFDKISGKENCVIVPAFKIYDVANAKPAHVKVYDYYDLAKSSVVSYEPPAALLCDICADDEQCTNRCNNIKHESTAGSGILAPKAYGMMAFMLASLLFAKAFM